MNKTLIVGGLGRHLDEVCDIAFDNGLDFKKVVIDFDGDFIHTLEADYGISATYFFAIDDRFLNQTRQFAIKLALFKQFKLSRIISNRASISSSAQIGRNVFVSEGASIGANSKISDGCVIHRNVTIGSNVRLGSNSWIDEMAIISSTASIGNNTVIGKDIFVGSVAIGYNCVLTYPRKYETDLPERTNYLFGTRAISRTVIG